MYLTHTSKTESTPWGNRGAARRGTPWGGPPAEGPRGGEGAPAEGPGGGGAGGGVPETVSLINNWDEQRNRKPEKTQKTKIRLVIYNVFLTFSPKSENDPMVDTHIMV